MKNNSDTPSQPVTQAKGSFRHVFALAFALVLIPLLLGVLAVLVSHKFNPKATPPAISVTKGIPFQDPQGIATASVERLMIWRRDLRRDGFSLDEANLRVWAAHAKHPDILFRIAPPCAQKQWHWYPAHGSRYVIAVSRQMDEIGRQQVALYDLITSQWLWNHPMRWPKTHELPHVINTHTLVHYAVNGRRFAMELNARGVIISMDSLGVGSATSYALPSPNARFPGEPLAWQDNLFFTKDPSDESLLAYATDALPGLYNAGKGLETTCFSGNGMLKFTALDGTIYVSDALTQTLLKRFDAWRHTSETRVTATLATRDGSRLTVFLSTAFESTPPVTREWTVTLTLPEGIVRQNFNADALFGKPKTEPSPCTTQSQDGLWELKIAPDNLLHISNCRAKKEYACCDLGSLLGLDKPIDQIYFLEDGRHVVLRQQDNFWLLDFAIARGYADLIARQQASLLAINKNPSVLSSVCSTNAESTVLSPETDPSRTPAVATMMALQAERCAANQAWMHATELLEESQRHPVWNGRTPNVNLFMLARYHLLANQPREAFDRGFQALRQLGTQSLDELRMPRYHMSRLLDAIP